jgi:D-3-phosphoglycerate dehydrogenase / 2-oxoglutarate reductase
VVAYDPHLPEEIAAKLDVELVGLDELLARSDAITVHVPQDQGDHRAARREAFAKCRKACWW